jgi:hypothetical protein
LWAVYGPNIIGERTVRQRCRIFKDGRTNVHDEKRRDRPSVLTDDLIQIVDKNICERRRFTISELSCEFPQISRTILYESITVRLGYHNFCTRWVPKMLTGAHDTQKMLSALIFTAIPQIWQ